MIETRVARQTLEVVLTGGDSWLCALRPRWSFVAPLDQVISVKAGPPMAIGARRHVNGPASERRHDTGRLFCARFRAPTLRIEMRAGPFRRVILSVPDPDGMARDISDAVAALPT